MYGNGQEHISSTTMRMVIWRQLHSLKRKQKAAGTYTGYFKINEDYYCLDPEGKPQTGEITLTVNGESNLYYFDPASSDIPGKMFHNGWLRSDTTKGERWLYFKKGNVPADIGKYYKRGVVATAIPEKGTGAYLLDANGYVLKSVMKKAQNGAYYCTDSNGQIYRNKLVNTAISDIILVQTESGQPGQRDGQKQAIITITFGSTPGRVVEKHGWQKLVSTSGKFLGWLYFDSNGNHYTDKWTSAGYYF